MGLGTIQSGRREFFAENHSVNVAIGTLGTLIVGFTIPPKARAIITSFGNYLGTVAAWGVAYWNIQFNGVNQMFYGGMPNIFDQVGYAAQRQPSTEIMISGGTYVAIRGSNPTAAILAMGVSIGGELIYQE